MVGPQVHLKSSVGLSACTAVTAGPLEIDTPHGSARVHLQAAPDAAGALVLGHGAGGGVSAPDLVAASRAALEQGFSVALVEQPYLVAGRRSSPPAYPKMPSARRRPDFPPSPRSSTGAPSW